MNARHNQRKVDERPRVDLIQTGEIRQMDFSSLPGQVGLDFARITGRKQAVLEHLTVLQVSHDYYGAATKADGTVVAGGTHSFIRDISEGLAKAYPITVHVACGTLNPDEKPRTIKNNDWKGTVVVHPIYRLGSDALKDAREVINLMRETDADVVHLHNPQQRIVQLGVALAATALERSLSVTFHNAAQNFKFDIAPRYNLRRTMEVFKEHFDTKGWKSIGHFLVEMASRGLGKLMTAKGVGLAIYNLAEKSGRIPLASYTLCSISEDSTAEFGKLDSLVVGNPIDTKFFSPENADEPHCSELKRQYDLEGKKVIVYHARITPDKGQRFLVDSLKDLQSKLGEDFKVVIIGTPDHPGYKREMQDQARKQGLGDKVLFLDAADPGEIRDWLHIADVMAFPSLREGLGRSGIEALCMKTPVVAFNVGGIPEYVTDSISGYLVDKGDRQGLANALCTVLQDPGNAADMGEHGRSIVASKYSVEKVCADYMNLVFAPAAIARRSL